MKDKITTWALRQRRPFKFFEAKADLQIKPEDLPLLKEIELQMIEEGLIEWTGNQGFTVIRSELLPIEEYDADSIGIVWPLGLEDYIAVKPSDLVVIGGVSGAGKSAFCLMLAEKNLFLTDKPIRYLSSELTGVHLKERLSELPLLTMQLRKKIFFYMNRKKPWLSIEKDALNIIDYLEPTDYTKVGDHLTACQEAVGNGVVVVAMQRDKGKEYSRGGSASGHRARVVINLDMNAAEIKKATALPENYHSNVSPVGMKCEFHFTGKGKIERTSDWFRPQEEEIRTTGRRR